VILQHIFIHFCIPHACDGWERGGGGEASEVGRAFEKAKGRGREGA